MTAAVIMVPKVEWPEKCDMTSNELDIASLPPTLPLNVCGWRICSLIQGVDDMEFLNFVTRFVHKCLRDPRPEDSGGGLSVTIRLDDWPTT